MTSSELNTLLLPIAQKISILFKAFANDLTEIIALNVSIGKMQMGLLMSKDARMNIITNNKKELR